MSTSVPICLWLLLPYFQSGIFLACACVRVPVQKLGTSPYVPPTLAERTSSAAPTFCALVNDKVYVNPRRMLKQRALMVDAMYAATPSIDVLDVDEQSASCGQRASH